MIESPPRAKSTAGLLGIVALAGAGTMVVEFSAVRLLAPWYGASSMVWTNVIGVILLALALGYLVGSRLSARPRPLAKLSWALLLAFATTLLLPALAAPIAGWFLPEGVTLDRAAGMITWGSLASSLLLFGPPALALGCVGPLAVEVVQTWSGAHAGTAGGRVLFASTVGSLAGTFGTTHYLVPELGVTRTYCVAAVALGVLGLLAMLLERRDFGRRGGLVRLLFFGLLLGGVEALAPSSARGERVRGQLLESVESPYQSVRVVELDEGEVRMRQLQVNEGFDSFQSVWQPEPGLLPPAFYYDYFCLPPWWSRGCGEWRVMVLGLGAGTAWRVLEGTMPEELELIASGVELDLRVVELARRWMDLPEDGPRRRTLGGWDARTALRHGGGEFEQIVLDTYANQMEIPPHLCTVEFFEEVKAHLAPGGWLSINIGGFGFDDPVVGAVAGTAATAFESEALLVRVPFSRNCVAFLRRDAPLPRPGGSGWSLEEPDLTTLLGPLELEGRWSFLPPGEVVALTDDHCPIESLQAASIAEAAARLERLGAR